MGCSHDDCQEKPRWKPVVELRSHPRSLTPRKLTFLRLGYCDAHKEKVTLADLLSDEGFDKAERAAREAGREKKLDRKASVLRWEKLARADLGRLARSQHQTTSPPWREEPEDDD